jgi:hypothetical protein
MTDQQKQRALEALDKLRQAAMGYVRLMSNGDAWQLDKTIRAALSAPVQCVPEEVKEALRMAAFGMRAADEWNFTEFDYDLGKWIKCSEVADRCEGALALLNRAATGGTIDGDS